MMSFNDYVKYVTEQLVIRIDQPKEVRQAQRAEQKARKPSFAYRAFGMLPIGVTLMLKRKRK